MVSDEPLVVCCGRLVEPLALVVGSVAGQQAGSAPGLDCAGAHLELLGDLAEREEPLGAQSVAVAGKPVFAAVCRALSARFSLLRSLKTCLERRYAVRGKRPHSGC